MEFHIKQPQQNTNFNTNLKKLHHPDYLIDI